MSSTAATGHPAATPVTAATATIAVTTTSVGTVKQELVAATGLTATSKSTLQQRHPSVPAGLARAVSVSKASISPSAVVHPGSSVYGAVSGGGAPGARAVSTAPLTGVSGSVGAGANAGRLGASGEEAGVQGGTGSAAQEMKAGLLGAEAAEAAAGILSSTGTFSIEAAGRAAAVADGVIRSDAPEHTQRQQLVARYPSVAQTVAALSSGTTTPAAAPAAVTPANIAFNNGVRQHQAQASSPTGVAPTPATGVMPTGATTSAARAVAAVYGGAYGVQRQQQEGQQTPSAVASTAAGHGFEGGYSRVHPGHRLPFQQGGAGGGFLGLPCGGPVSHVHAQAQAQAQAAQAQVQAQAQAQAEAQTQAQTKAKKPNGLRRGKWTSEEEEYANRLIQEFKSGLLPLTDGTTLRTFLSKLLNCDPMRISKKFVGSNCIGKQVFRRRQADMDRLQTSDIEKSRSELADLERRFLERVAMTNRCKTSGELGAKEGSRDFDTMRPHPPSSATQPWMLPPSPDVISGSHMHSTVGQQPSAATSGVTLLDHARVHLPSASTSNAPGLTSMATTAEAAAAVPVASASVVTSVVAAPVAGSTSLVTALPDASGVQRHNANSLHGEMEAGGSARSTSGLSVGASSKLTTSEAAMDSGTVPGPPQQPNVANVHSPQQQQIILTSSVEPSGTGASRSRASSPTPETAVSMASILQPAPMVPASGNLASGLEVPQPTSFLDSGDALPSAGSGTGASATVGQTVAGGAVVSPATTKQEPVEVSSAKGTGLNVLNTARANVSTKSSAVAAEGGMGSSAVSAAATLGVGIDRTTSLEALSLLELPHLQGMPNLAILGLGPVLPTSSAALSMPMSLPTTPVKGVTSSVGFKRDPSWARISSYENLQSLEEGFPVEQVSSGLSNTETSGSTSVGVSHGLEGSSSSNTMGSGSGPALSAFMPRNTSVEDFLSLVESGDIPPPEGAAGFTVPMWIYGDDSKSTEKTSPKSPPKPKSKESGTSSKLISVSGVSGVAEQPRSKRLKASSTKTEAKG